MQTNWAVWSNSSNLAGQAIDRRIQFLRRRADLLDVKRWPAGQGTAVSDFWFAQLQATAESCISGEPLRALLELHAQLACEVASAKLLVLLDAPADWLVRNNTRAPASKTALTVDDFARYRTQLHRLTDRPGRGPVLQLDATDPSRAIEEVVGAITAMESPCIVEAE